MSPSRLAARQNSARRFRASSGPPRASPSATITALTAQAEVPDMPSISIRLSFSNSSSTPGERAVRAAALKREIDALPASIVAVGFGLAAVGFAFAQAPAE